MYVWIGYVENWHGGRPRSPLWRGSVWLLSRYSRFLEKSVVSRFFFFIPPYSWHLTPMNPTFQATSGWTLVLLCSCVAWLHPNPHGINRPLQFKAWHATTMGERTPNTFGRSQTFGYSVREDLKAAQSVALQARATVHCLFGGANWGPEKKFLVHRHSLGASAVSQQR